MSKHDSTTKAWTDVSFRGGLTEQERAALPAHPAGLIELSDEELDGYAGAYMNPTIRYGPSWPGCG